MLEEMRRDENVIFMGEDIGIYGGVFGVLVGMIDEFGLERVRDIFILEVVIVGVVVGVVVIGLRFIMEVMFMDFVIIFMDVIVN